MPSLILRSIIFSMFMLFVLADDMQAYWKNLNETCQLVSVLDGGQTLEYNCSGEKIFMVGLYDTPDADFIHVSDNAEYVPGQLTPLINSTVYISDEYVDSLLAKRANVRVCGHEVSSSVCANLATSIIEKVSAKVASLFKDMGNACTTSSTLVFHNGSSSNYLHIQVENSVVNGNNCDTTAQLSTILGAMEKWFKKHEHFCGVWCTRESHGGTWEGYVSIGVNKVFSVKSCNNYGAYGGCVSGGKNDIL